MIGRTSFLLIFLGKTLRRSGQPDSHQPGRAQAATSWSRSRRRARQLCGSSAGGNRDDQPARKPDRELSALARRHSQRHRGLPGLARSARARRHPAQPAHLRPAREPAQRSHGARLPGRVLARQDRADQRDVLRRFQAAPAALRRRPHHHVSDRDVLRPGRGALHPPAADRDAQARGQHRLAQAAPDRVGQDQAQPAVAGGDGQGHGEPGRDQAGARGRGLRRWACSTRRTS